MLELVNNTDTILVYVKHRSLLLRVHKQRSDWLLCTHHKWLVAMHTPQVIVAIIPPWWEVVWFSPPISGPSWRGQSVACTLPHPSWWIPAGNEHIIIYICMYRKWGGSDTLSWGQGVSKLSHTYLMHKVPKCLCYKGSLTCTVSLIMHRQVVVVDTTIAQYYDYHSQQVHITKRTKTPYIQT